MNCKGYREWLLRREEAPEAGAARAHEQACPQCGQLARLDAALESTLCREIRRVELPATLRERVARDLAAPPARRKPRTVWAILPLAAAAALALLFWLPGSGPRTGQIGSLEDLGRLAVENHLKGMSAQFRADEVGDVPAWFRDRLAYPVRLPSLEARQLTLTGGRTCSLGPEKVAYLFYDRGGERLSYYHLPASKLAFMLEEGPAGRIAWKGRAAEVWRTGDDVHLLVE
jgi:anti-sigma factor RsiW